MPTVIRKYHPLVIDTRREVHRSLTWHVRSSTLWSPPTDVYEVDGMIVVKIEIAGVKDDDLEVSVQNNVLTVSGARSDSSERRAYHQMEIPFGKFSVVVELPSAVDVEEASAEYKDGFLAIQLPKESMDQ